MNRSLDAIAALVGSVDGVLLLVKVTILLGAGAAVAWLVRHRSAAARHGVWALTLWGAVALAAAAPFARDVAVPAAYAKIANLSNVAHAANAVTAVGGAAYAPTSVSTVVAGSGARVGMVNAASSVSLATPAVGGAVVRSMRSRPATWLGTIWITGTLLLLAWSALGHVLLVRLARRATPITSPEWQSLFAAAAGSLDVRRPVRLASSAQVGTPITWGTARPIVLLPAEADAWPVERRRAALLHELAHVARRDYLVQLMSTVACAAYWFHPMVWIAARRLRADSERACDDRVLGAGTPAEDYAAQLLDVARGASVLRLHGAVAIGMARRSALEGRLLALLDDRMPRRPVSLRVALVASVMFAALLTPVACVRPVAATELSTQRVAESEQSAAVTTVDADEQSVTTSKWQQSTDSGRTTEWTLPARAGAGLRLDLRPGGDVNIRAWDEPSVRVRASLGGRDWRDVRVAVTPDDDGVLVRATLEARRTQSTSSRFEIMVPGRFDVRLSSGGGGITIVGVRGTFRGSTGGGDIVLERVNGEANLSTGGGEVRVSDSEVNGRVSTGGGLVRISRVRGDLKGSSGSGPVIYSEGSGTREDTGTGSLDYVTVDRANTRVTARPRRSDATRDATGRLHISKAGGDIDLDEAPDGAVVSTAGGRVRVGPSAGMLDASSGGGDVIVGPVSGSVTAGTGAGRVQVIVGDGKGEPQVIEARSGSGRVIVELPAGFSGVLEIETAYTERNGRASRITSDFDLERDPVTGWDSHEGTARKYVRAHGRIGSGRSRVTVKTVNGDVELRRRD